MIHLTPQQTQRIIRTAAYEEFTLGDCKAMYDLLTDVEDNYFTPGVAWSDEDVTDFLNSHKREIDTARRALDTWLSGEANIS